MTILFFAKYLNPFHIDSFIDFIQVDGPVSYQCAVLGWRVSLILRPRGHLATVPLNKLYISTCDN